MEDEPVVRAFPFHTANPSFAGSVRFRRLVGRLQLLNAGAPGYRCELFSVLLVAVVNEVVGFHPREWLLGAAGLPRRP